MLNFQQLHLGISHAQDYREFQPHPSDELCNEQRLEKALIPSCVQRGNTKLRSEVAHSFSPRPRVSASPHLSQLLSLNATAYNFLSPSFPICPKYYVQTQLSITFVGGES